MRPARWLFMGLFVAVGCSDTTENDPAPYTIEGVAQKGPFALGSNVALQELSSALDATGKVYNVTTSDELGAFKLGTPLTVPAVEIIADGQFYNEIIGPNPASIGATPERIALRAFVVGAAGGTKKVYVNLLTHLQSARLKKLVESGKPFAAANDQSRNETLTALRLPPIAQDAAGIPLVGAGDAPAELLALSVLVEEAAIARMWNGGGTVTAIAGELRQDLEDGTLDDPRNIEALDHARFVFANGYIEIQRSTTGPLGGLNDIEAVAENLRKYYADHGVAVEVPDWRKFFPLQPKTSP